MKTLLVVSGSFFRQKVILRCGITFGFLLLGMNRLSAQITETKLLPGDGAAYNLFGNSVSLSGDYALIGAYYDDDNGAVSGSAYVFRREGTDWIEEAKLTASDGAEEDHFGNSVSLSGDYALIGAFLDGDNGDYSGSAYIFRREGTSWTEEVKLTASDGAAEDRFGNSVSLSGDYALIGASGDDNYRGSVYIFRREGTDWIEEAKVTASDGASSDQFGFSASLSGDLALVGVWGNEAAYILRREGTDWIEETKVTASDSASGDHFGISVSFSGNYALIGAYGDDDYRGSAYIYSGILTSAEEGQPGEVCGNFSMSQNYPTLSTHQPRLTTPSRGAHR